MWLDTSVAGAATADVMLRITKRAWLSPGDRQPSHARLHTGGGLISCLSATGDGGRPWRRVLSVCDGATGGGRWPHAHLQAVHTEQQIGCLRRVSRTCRLCTADPAR